jgi:hypothetical protein
MAFLVSACNLKNPAFSFYLNFINDSPKAPRRQGSQFAAIARSSYNFTKAEIFRSASASHEFNNSFPA